MKLFKLFLSLLFVLSLQSITFSQTLDSTFLYKMFVEKPMKENMYLKGSRKAGQIVIEYKDGRTATINLQNDFAILTISSEAGLYDDLLFRLEKNGQLTEIFRAMANGELKEIKGKKRENASKALQISFPEVAIKA